MNAYKDRVAETEQVKERRRARVEGGVGEVLVEPGNEEQTADRHAVASGEGENIQIHRRSQPCKCVLHIQRVVRNKSCQSPYLCIIQVMLTMAYTLLCWIGTEKKMPKISGEVN